MEMTVALVAGMGEALIDELKALRVAGELKILRGTFDAELIDVEFIEKATGQQWHFNGISGRSGRLSKAGT